MTRIRLQIVIDQFDGRKIAEHRDLVIKLDYPEVGKRSEINLVSQLVVSNLQRWTTSVQGSRWSNLYWSHYPLKIIKGIIKPWKTPKRGAV